MHIKRKLATREFIEADYQNKQNLAKECFEGNSQLNKLIKACKQIELEYVNSLKLEKSFCYLNIVY